MKRATLEQAIAKTNALHAPRGVINGRVITLGKIWDIHGKRWAWCERFMLVGEMAHYMIEGKWLFEPVYQPAF